MSYVFAFLVLVNAAVLGYFVSTPPKDTSTLASARMEVGAGVDFVNRTNALAPQIGEK